MSSFKIYYLNIRDIKCKRDSFEEIIAINKPTVIALTETWTDDSYDMELEGYVKYPNNRNEEGGGVLVAVRKELKNVTTEVKRTKDAMESLWIVINNHRIKIRIGIVYLPQEQDQDLKEIYSIIKQQVEESEKEDEALIIIGDFNCKVGKSIDGNKDKISKGGKKMLEFLEKKQLVLANSLDVCDGLWTREENNKKSVLDYVIVDKELSEHLKKVTIYDGSKELSPFHLKRESAKNIRTIYSDHNPIIIETDLVMKQIKTEEGRKRRILTDEGKVRYRNELAEKKISRIWENPKDLQKAYQDWQKEVEETKNKFEQVRKITKKRRSKTLRLLMKEKKRVKEELREKECSVEDMEKLQELKEKILNEEQEGYYRKLMKTCEEVSLNGRFNSGNFLKVKKRMERKKPENNHAVKNKKGELVTENGEILRCYEEYFSDLLTKTNENTKLERNRDVVKIVEKKFDKIMAEGCKQTPKKTDIEMVSKVVNGLKRRKAQDDEGWNNEMMMDGGTEMVESLTKMADAIQQREEIPNPWNHMTIKSTHKKGELAELPNKRGLFLTNVVSKVFERVIDKSNEVRLDKHQNGGTQNRGTIDNWIIMQAQIDEGKRLKKPVYLFFADLVKCFDRLWLKDCIVDLHECGMREKEASLIYKLNKEAIIKVATPAGITEEIKVNEIVKQGTVFGPKLCCASTGNINKELEMEEVVYPGVSIQALTFVDDILGGGRREFTKAVMEECQKKEQDKLWEFSTEKSKWMCISNGKKNLEGIEVEVMQGKLQKTDVYKYVGNMVNEKGNMDDQLKFMENKTYGIVHDGRKMCCRSKIGKHEVEAKGVVYKQLAVPSIFYNVEAWTNFRKYDIQKLECIQGKVLKGLFGLPKSTPYWGLLFELDVVPIMLLITYKRLMLYHSLINSDERRVAKHVVKAQEQSGHEECWFGNMKRESKEIDLQISEDQVKGKLKSSWKKEVKKKINLAVEKKMVQKKAESKKMRFLLKKGNETYLQDTYNEDARVAMKIRLNMIEWIEGNMGREVCCPLCESELDTTEHVFACVGSENDTNLTIKDLEEGRRMKEIVELFSTNEQNRREQLLHAIQTNLEQSRRDGIL